MPETSKVVLDQIRTLDQRQLGRRLGAVSAPTMRAANRAIRRSLAVESD